MPFQCRDQLACVGPVDQQKIEHTVQCTESTLECYSNLLGWTQDAIDKSSN